MSTNNSKRLSLTKGGAFSWQGVGSNQLIMGIPMMFIPLLMYLPFGYFEIPYIGLAVISGLSLVSLLFYESWINLIVKRFKMKKYQMAAGFRKED